MQDSSVYTDSGNVSVPNSPQSGVKIPVVGDDRVQSAFVSLVIARLERDHVALLAALCDLDQPQRSAARGGEVMQQALATVLREELRQTQHALERAADGRLGYCERCGAPLTISVLLAQPATMHCPGCAAAIARGSQVH